MGEQGRSLRRACCPNRYDDKKMILKTDGILFHYTSHAALHSIVVNHCVRATHAYYLNDSNEIKFAIAGFEKLLDKKIDESSKTTIKEFLQYLKQWLKNLKDNAHYIFVFSMSEHRNLLSQWRAYTVHGSGISIGFDVDDLRRLAKRHNLNLIECVYNKDDREKVLLRELERVISEYESKFILPSDDQAPDKNGYLDFLNEQTASLLKTFCTIKDPTFKEEGEWRLISKYYKYYTDSEIKFRPGKTTLIPYIEIDIQGIRDDGYLFDQVYPGPSPNFELSFQSISAFLSNKHACRVIISPQSAWTER